MFSCSTRYFSNSLLFTESFHICSGVFSNIFKEKLPTPLGRWGIDDSIENKNIRATFANYDSCGDNLCGNPTNLIDQINYIKNKDSKDKFIVIGDDVVKIN